MIKPKKLIALFMTVVMLITVMSCGFSALAVVMCETQFVYDSADMSWLKDLIFKENMSSVDGLSQRNTLVPKAEYPYRETPESFKEEIANYQTVYTLDENMANAAYLYMLDLAKAFAGPATENYSDDFIKSYLESIGIVYPENSEDDDETKIVARALFSIIISDENYKVKKGTGLYEAFTDYVSVLLGVNVGSILKFDNNTELIDLNEYVIAACKYMLFNSGYDVSKDTSDEEVFRLIAIMTIRSQGISIDSGTATFEEIKNKYLCAMMCKIYDVSIDTVSFEKAVKNDRLAFYILQLIGKEYGLTVRDSLTYEQAFDLVCKNTDFFNLEEGEFYADIYEYDVKLNYKRDTIWLYPQTLGTTSESDGTKVNVFINGKDVRENYYVDVSIDSSKEVVPVVIKIEFTDASGVMTSSSYRLNVYQGTKEPPAAGTISDSLTGVKDVVEDVLKDLGLDSSIAGLIVNIPFELPTRLLGITSLIVPSFSNLPSLGTGLLTYLFGYSKDDDSNVNTDSIGGVGGLDSFNSSGNSSQSMNFGSLNIGNIQLNTNNLNSVMKPADSIVIPDNQLNQTPQIQDEGQGWFEELMSDTTAVIIICVVLLLTFGVCFTLFIMILNEKSARDKIKKRND
ncbi:MAG: cadherin-like beta sandwich domain-containing protein [Clostridia bacterium]|nr:cadherin-like beta sandwich domain-containing protein [Clostridia bacterium]